MNQEYIDDLDFARKFSWQEVEEAEKKIRFLKEAVKGLEEKCDHIYPNGSLAKRPGYVCKICGRMNSIHELRE